MYRRIVFGSGLVALVPTVSAATPVLESKEPQCPPPMRPSELPIYESPHADYGEYVSTISSVTFYILLDTFHNFNIRTGHRNLAPK